MNTPTKRDQSEEGKKIKNPQIKQLNEKITTHKSITKVLEKKKKKNTTQVKISPIPCLVKNQNKRR